jgi:hypothetical protein
MAAQWRPLGAGVYNVKVKPGPHFYEGGFGNQAENNQTGMCVVPDMTVLREWGWLNAKGEGHLAKKTTE